MRSQLCLRMLLSRIGYQTRVDRSSSRVTQGKWHTVRASRTGRIGQLTIDSQTTSVEGISPGRFTQLTLLDRLYVGGSANWKHVYHLAAVNRSFHGCIQLASIIAT